MNFSVAIGATVGSGVINSKKKTDSGFRTLSVGTRDGNRTRTIITDRRILSPVRLPVPPPGRFDITD